MTLETARKISRKIRGVPEPELLVDEEPFRADLKHADIQIFWQNKPISQHTPTCPACGEKLSRKDVERVVDRHGITARAVHVNQEGERNELLNKLYEKIRAGRITATEVLNEERRIHERFDEKPKNERPISEINDSIPLDCPKCERRLGLVKVAVRAKPPDRPIRPDVSLWVRLPKTPQEERWIREELNISKEYSLDEWLQGKDVQGIIEKMQVFRNEVINLPYLPQSHRAINDLSSAIYTAMESIRTEIARRGDRIFNVLTNPPKPPPRKPEPM